MRPMLLILFASSVLKAEAHPPSASTEQTQKSEIKQIMHDIFYPLRLVYSTGLHEEEFRKPQNREKILKAFADLENSSHKLARHVNKDLVFSYTGQSLEKDIKQASRWFAEKSYPEASFAIRHLVEDCSSCHSKTKAESSFGEALVDAKDEKNLNSYELARLKISARQFDKAQTLLEQLILDPFYSPEDLHYHGVFIAYFKLMLRVKHDVHHTLLTLQKMAAKKQPDGIREALTQWIEDLKQLDNAKYFSQKGDLALAKGQIDQAQGVMTYAMNQVGLVRYIAASAILQEIVASNNTDKPTQAEAYYLLGLTENLLESSFWVNESRYYWEAAIHTYPQSEIAMKAFKDLFDRVVQGFNVNSIRSVPPDTQRWLEDLYGIAKSANIISPKS